jgi:maltose O-acetyltransferase
VEVLDGATVVDVARRNGVVQTVHDWRRYAAEGLAGRVDGSSRPQSCPHQMPPGVEARILELRRAHPGWGPAPSATASSATAWSRCRRARRSIAASSATASTPPRPRASAAATTAGGSAPGPWSSGRWTSCGVILSGGREAKVVTGNVFTGRFGPGTGEVLFALSVLTGPRWRLAGFADGDPMTDSTTPPADDRSPKQRMLAGDLYIADDPELVADSLRARQLYETFNASPAADVDGRRRILAELLGGLGEGSEIRPPFYCDYGYNLRVGTGVFVNVGLVALDVAPITIGDDVQIGPNVQLLTPTHPVEAGPRRARWEAARPITIGDNVWLGGGAVVLPGVTIGENTVVGAGAVAARDLPPGVVAVGNPARIVRTL